MTKTLYMARAQHAGFTLIELLLVMVILVVLAGVVVTRFSGSTDKAKIAAAKTDIEAIKNALQLFYISEGHYPSTAEGLVVLVHQPTAAKGAASQWPMLEKGLPNDPWGHPYIYRFPPTQGPDFDLLSGGPDEHEGGDDDIVSWKN